MDSTPSSSGTESDAETCNEEQAIKKPSGIFSREVTQKLESLYDRGMTGWGKAHDSIINVALTSTGLTLSQLKVLDIWYRICYHVALT